MTLLKYGSRVVHQDTHNDDKSSKFESTNIPKGKGDQYLQIW